MSQPSPTRTRFPPTRWSLVIEAREEEAGEALDELSQLYWLPLYAYARRKGLDPEDAEDLTQEFFVKLIEEREKMLRDLDPSHGRLRTFFLTIFQRRITDWRRRRFRRKRGSGLPALGLEAAEAVLAEKQLAHSSPERDYDRQWALSILDLALGRLERDYAAQGREDVFQLLRPFLGMNDEDAPDYEAVRGQAGLSAESARQTVHRFRNRFRTVLRAEISETLHVPTEEAIDRELLELQDALR